MAHAFDKQNFVPGKQQIFYSVDSPSLSHDDIWERSSSPQLLSRSNQPSPSFEATIINKTVTNHQNTKLSTLDDSSYRQRQQQQQPITDDYFTFTSENGNNETKPPPPSRVPRMTATTNNNYIRRSNILSQCSSNGIKTNKTYLNTTQLYITQPSSPDSPPPPPPPRPRYSLHPPAIPPRNPIISNQKNSITIPDFNSSTSPKAIYRSPVVSIPIERHDSHQHRFNSLSIDNNNNHHHHHTQETINESTVGEYSSECCKCGETITNLDDPCDILGRIYHASCAICVICEQSVKNKHFFIKNQLYCEEDFLKTGFYETLEHCVVCKRFITDTIIQAFGESYHLTCFKCSKCLICLDGRPFIRDKKQNLFCSHDYHMTYGPRCDKCSNPICPEDDSNDTVRIISMGKTFHVKCYQCEDCSMQLGNEQDYLCYPLDEILLCKRCYHRRLTFVNKF